MWSLGRRRNFPSLETRPGLTGSLQSCGSHAQGENTKGRNSSGVETGQCCATQLGNFSKYVNNKRRSEENIGPILVGDGHLKEKWRPSMLFLPQSLRLTILDCLVLRQRTAAVRTVCGFPFVATEFLRDHQYPLDVQKSRGLVN